MSTDNVMMSIPHVEAVRQAELLTLRQISDSLQNLYSEQVKHSEVLYSVKEDVAVLKMRMEDTRELEAKVNRLESSLIDLQMRNAKEDGGKSTVTTSLDFFYKFGPWALGAGAAAFELLHH